MGLLVIQHKVRDYQAWRPIYDGHEAARRAAGIVNGRVYRSADDANDLVVVFDIKDIDKARAFGQSDDLRTTMAKAGVIGPPTVLYLAPA